MSRVPKTTFGRSSPPCRKVQYIRDTFQFDKLLDFRLRLRLHRIPMSTHPQQRAPGLFQAPRPQPSCFRGDTESRAFGHWQWHCRRHRAVTVSEEVELLMLMLTVPVSERAGSLMLTLMLVLVLAQSLSTPRVSLLRNIHTVATEAAHSLATWLPCYQAFNDEKLGRE